jgi:hypothetical protein
MSRIIFGSLFRSEARNEETGENNEQKGRPNESINRYHQV